MNSSVEMAREVLEMRARAEAELTTLRHERSLKADAERLAELKREHDMLRLPVVELGIRPPRETTDRIRSLQALIAVYEECAARGLAFGGGR